MRRFVKEYAKFRYEGLYHIQQHNTNEYVKETVTDAMNMVMTILRCYEKGTITENEAMTKLVNVYKEAIV